jgi:hypothetical protein
LQVAAAAAAGAAAAAAAAAGGGAVGASEVVPLSVVTQPTQPGTHSNVVDVVRQSHYNMKGH